MCLHRIANLKLTLEIPFDFKIFSVYIQYICTLIVQWANNGDCEAVCEKCLCGSQMKSGLLYY